MGKVINGYDGSTSSVNRIEQALEQYSEDLTDWSTIKARSIVKEVNQSDLSMWRRNAKTMSKNLFNTIKHTSIGHMADAMINEQIKYMKSLPIEAAHRVKEIHDKSLQVVASGKRSNTLFNDIMNIGNVAASRARLIARTEVSRASTALTQSRAMSLGSEGYIWRTAGDSDVRDSHSQMEGKFVRWDSPPTLDGMTGHAGTFPNDRCYPEVVIPDYYYEEAA